MILAALIDRQNRASLFYVDLLVQMDEAYVQHCHETKFKEDTLYKNGTGRLPTVQFPVFSCLRVDLTAAN